MEIWYGMRSRLGLCCAFILAGSLFFQCVAFGATTFQSERLKCTFQVPSGYSVVESEGFLYIGAPKQVYQKKDSSGYGMAIPYIILGSYTWSKSELQFLEQFTKQIMRPTYRDLKILSPAAEEDVSGRHVWQIRYTYTIQNGRYTIFDTRIALKYHGRVYMIGTKEEGKTSKALREALRSVVGSLRGLEKQYVQTRSGKGVRVVPFSHNDLSYTQVRYPEFSKTNPQGWNVRYNMPGGVTTFALSVVNPQNPACQMFFLWSGSNFNQSEDAKNWFRQNRPIGYQARVATPVINPANAAGFFKVFSQCRRLNPILPVLDGFQTLSILGKAPNGGDVIHGAFFNGDSAKCEGYFTASVWKMSAYGVPDQLTPLFVSGVQFFTARAGELGNYIDIYEKCLGSLQFSPAFQRAHMEELRAAGQNSAYISQTYDSISSSMRQSYANRSSMHTIKSQEYSDATLGIEAVIDRDTGEFYSADTGTVAKLNASGLNERGRYEVVSGKDTLRPRSGRLTLR